MTETQVMPARVRAVTVGSAGAASEVAVEGVRAVIRGVLRRAAEIRGPREVVRRVAGAAVTDRAVTRVAEVRRETGRAEKGGAVTRGAGVGAVTRGAGVGAERGAEV